VNVPRETCCVGRQSRTRSRAKMTNETNETKVIVDIASAGGVEKGGWNQISTHETVLVHFNPPTTT